MNRWFVIAALVLAGAACSDDQKYSGNDNCPGGEVIEYEGDSFCIVVEEGFLCPEAFPEGEEIEDVLVCAESDKGVPEDIEDELRELGFLPSESPNNGTNNGTNNGDVCEEIQDRHQDLLDANTSCETNADCQVLNDQCGVGLGGCYAYVNNDVNQDELTALGQEFHDAGCTSGVCDCDIPWEVTCENQVCTPVDPRQCNEQDPWCAAAETGHYQSFESECAALEAGAEPIHARECDTCRVGDRGACGAAAFCGNRDGACGAFGNPESGLCLPNDLVCDVTFPVCGCDGETYSSACAAHNAGTTISAYGGCAQDEGWECGGASCSETESCYIAFNDVPDEEPFFQSCLALPEDCEEPSCDCFEEQPFEYCLEIGGHVIRFSPGG